MQLKSLAKSTEVLNKVTSVLNNTELSHLATKHALEGIGKSYTTQTLKEAIALSKLDKEQIKVILSANGLQGELLETTTAELANSTTTNTLSASQATTTTTTLGLGTAFQGLGIKTKQATASMWKFLTTNPLGWATLAASTIAALAFGVKKYNDAIEEAKESARERTSELFDEFKQMNDTLSDHKKTVSELADRYDELSKGVDTFNNSNISLSDDEYTEFLDINQQLIDMFPELYDGLGENGSSILKIGTSAQSASEYLQGLIEKEEELNNIRIANNLDELFKNTSLLIDDSNDKISDLEDKLNNIDDAWKNAQKMNAEDILGLDRLEIGDNTELQNAISRSIQQLQDEVYSDLQNGKIDSNQYTDFIEQFVNPALYNDNATVFNGYVDLMSLDKNQKAELQRIIKEQTNGLMNEFNDSVSEATGNISLEKQNLDAIWVDFVPELVASMKSKANFKNLDEVGLGDFAVSLVEQLDSSIVAELNGTAYENDIYGYVRDKILVPIQDAITDESGEIDTDALENIKDKISDAMDLKDAFNKDEVSISDYTSQVNDLISTLELLGMSPDIIKNIKILFSYGDEENDLQNSIRKITDDHGISDREQVAVLNEYTKDFTLSQKNLWLEATIGADNATQAIKMYEKALEDVQQQADQESITPTISSSVQQLATQLEPQFAKLGEAYKAIFTENGFTLDDVDNSMLEDLRKSFAEIEEEIGVVFDASTLEPFFDTLTDSSSTADQVQQAFNDLATAYFYNTETLGQLNDETADAIEKQLEEMGVANAEEIVMQALAEAKARAFLASYDLADATNADITAMLNEAESAGIATDMIFKLVAEEQVFNAQGLSTEGKVAQLKELATAYGQTAVAAKIARMEDEYTKSHQPINYEEIAKAAHAEINGAINSVHVDFKGVGNSKKSGSGSGSSAKSTAEEYDWIEQAIENVEKEIKELDEVANSSYSTFSEKNEALTKEIGKVTEEIELQQKAYDEYMRKADSIPLSEKYKELVRNGEIDIETINDDNLRQNISEYQKWYDKAQNVSDAIKQLKTDIKDLYIETYKLQTDNLKDRLDSDSITEKQYLEGLKAAYEQFYANLEDFAQQYHEAVLDYLDKEKDYLNNVAGAAASLIDEEINNIRDDADEQENRIKRQIELLEDRKKPLQDELDALEEKAKRENLILNLQRAQYAQAKAENQRNKLVYTSDRGMIYTNDSEAIRNAKRDVDDAKLEIQKQSIQDQIDALDNEIDRYNDLIDQINKAADAQIDALEKIKNKWQEAIDLQEYAENVSLLTDEFGDNAVEKILTGNDDDLLAQWKNSYITTLAEIDKESQGYIGNMTQQMASLYGIDLSPLQSQFQGVKESVDVVTNALGEAATAVGVGTSQNNETTNKSAQNNDGNNKGTSLESAIQNETQTAINAFDQHTDKITNEVIPAIQAATAEMNTFNESADVDIEKTITITYQTSGKPSDNISGNAHVEGTVGNAFANGTGAYKGLPKAEKNALVSEYGQTEMTVLPNGKTIITDTPTIMDLPKDTVIYNEEQTKKIMDNKVDTSGNAHADGTDADGWITLADGRQIRPIQPGDRAWEVQKAFEPFINKIISGEMELVNTAMFEHQKQMDEMAKQINYVNSVTNNRNVQPSINIGDINVTCPGVTSQEVMHEVGNALNKQIGHLSQRAMQEAYKR